MKHELLEYAATGTWGDILWGDSTPLKDHLHPDVVALFLDSINTGTPKKAGFRKKGGSLPRKRINPEALCRGSHAQMRRSPIHRTHRENTCR